MKSVSMRGAPLKHPDYRLWERVGLLGWWLNLTAPPLPSRSAPIIEQECIRKAELTSISILSISACLLALVSNSLADPTTAEAVVAIAISLLIAAAFNRTGHTRVATYLVPSVMLLIMAANVVQGTMELINLPIYDLFAIPIFLVSLIGDRRAPWVFAMLAIAFVVGSYLSLPHAEIQLPSKTTFDGIGYEQAIFGVWGMVNRHVILLFFAALLGWLGARSVDQAILRADRSDEFAFFLEEARRREADQARALNDFLQEIVEVFVAQANGEPRYLSARSATDPFHAYVQLVNVRLRHAERLRRQQGIWSQGQVVQTLVVLVQRLSQVLNGALPLRAIAPENIHTDIQVIGQLTDGYWRVLSQVATPRPSGHV